MGEQTCLGKPCIPVTEETSEHCLPGLSFLIHKVGIRLSAEIVDPSVFLLSELGIFIKRQS